jgi:cobalamin biosynthesis Mg chelatase CobN
MSTLTHTAIPLKDAGAGRLDIRRALAKDAPSAENQGAQQPASAGQQVATTAQARSGSPAVPARPTAPSRTSAHQPASQSSGWSKPVLALVAAALIGVTGSAVWQAHRARRDGP